MRNSLVNWIRCAAAAVVLLAAQSCDEAGGYEGGSAPVTWREHTSMSVSSAGVSFEFSFTTRAAWRAYSDNPSMLTIVSETSGPLGTNRMKVEVAGNDSGSERQCNIMITVEGYEPQPLLTVTQSVSTHSDYAVNRDYTDKLLEENYLWNDEYKRLTRNFEQEYDAFLENTLMSMKENVEDGSVDEKGNRTRLYSYITRTRASSRSVEKKTAEPTFGVLNVVLVSFYDQSGKPTGEYALCLQGVYPDTPAAKAGLHRGTWVLKADGKALTASNINQVFASLVASPTEGSTMRLTVMDEYSAAAEQKEVTLTAVSMALNPVLHSQVIERNGTKTGYLVYGNFEASFDDELLAEIRRFRTEGIGELVLDLRVNGGGHVISSQMLSSIIAGTQGDGKTFVKMEYNPSRMSQLGYSFPDNMFAYEFGPDAAHQGERISEYSRADYLSLQRVFILVSGSTASASELTFSSLQGIDFPVTLIGERTEGKNVGMEPRLFTCDGYEYTFYPITFRSYNAKNVSCDHHGTKPDYEVSEWTAGGNSYWPWGSDKDPVLGKALELITGVRAQPTRAAAGAVRARPERYFRTPRGGMIAPLPAEEQRDSFEF